VPGGPLRRNDEVYLDALGAQRLPDPTTAGDFCRRFTEDHIEGLMEAINDVRLKVWRQQPEEFFAEAVLDADGTLAPTTGECKQGMDVSYKGVWGYHPLLISLANTKEPLYLVNRSGNRPSYEGERAYASTDWFSAEATPLRAPTSRTQARVTNSEVCLQRWSVRRSPRLSGRTPLESDAAKLATARDSGMSGEWHLILGSKHCNQVRLRLIWD